MEQDSPPRYATLSPLPNTFECAKHREIPTREIPTLLGPPGTPDQGLRAEAVTPAGLGTEKVSQWQYFAPPEAPEDIAEQTQSGETLTCRCYFQAEISPFHTCWAPAIPRTVSYFCKPDITSLPSYLPPCLNLYLPISVPSPVGASAPPKSPQLKGHSSIPLGLSKLPP